MLEKMKAKGPVSLVVNNILLSIVMSAFHSYSSYSKFFYQYFKNYPLHFLNIEENREVGTE